MPRSTPVLCLRRGGRRASHHSDLSPRDAKAHECTTALIQRAGAYTGVTPHVDAKTTIEIMPDQPKATLLSWCLKTY